MEMTVRRGVGESWAHHLRHLLVEVVDKPPDIVVKAAEAHGVQARPFSGKSAGCASIASDRSAQVLLHSLGQPHEDVDLVPRRKINLLIDKRVADRPGVRPEAGLASAGDVFEEVADFCRGAWMVSGVGVSFAKNSVGTVSTYRDGQANHARHIP